MTSPSSGMGGIELTEPIDSDRDACFDGGASAFILASHHQRREISVSGYQGRLALSRSSTATFALTTGSNTLLRFCIGMSVGKRIIMRQP